MKKKLPEVKKSLKTFILEEDAKVIDKSAIKIAGMISIVGFALTSTMVEANAGPFSHTNTWSHQNTINANLNPSVGVDVQEIPIPSGSTSNDLTVFWYLYYNHGIYYYQFDPNKIVIDSITGEYTYNIERDAYSKLHIGENPTDNVINNIAPKSVETVHSNHYNHKDGSGWFRAIFQGGGNTGGVSGSASANRIDTNTYIEFNNENHENPLPEYEGDSPNTMR